MTTSRQAYKIDAEHPGSEVAAETAAAMAAASLVFRSSDPYYSLLLLQHAEQLFEFGDKYRGKYDGSVRVVKSYYPSVSGYYDELLWAALWLHRATGDVKYLDYAVDNAEAFGGTTWAVSEFSWDIKYAGVQVLASKVRPQSPLLLLPAAGEKRCTEERHRKILEVYNSKAEHYVCSCLNKSDGGANVRRTPGGLLFVRQWNNLQYVAGATFLLTAFSDYLSGGGGGGGVLRLPGRVHHRAASTVAYKEDKAFIGCAQGFDVWFGRQKDNPNALVGAIVGGPDAKDEFRDRRSNYMQTEACTYNTAPVVGVFAKFRQLQQKQEKQQQQKQQKQQHLLQGLQPQTSSYK
uniref:cellulase n=1 Tax=Ananas comosus var. bracteatus TaxID=296719 RepID=A0A6V7Q924_ANACO|nr:unnamed protein product [Ananas comosus var. bracteatus]